MVLKAISVKYFPAFPPALALAPALTPDFALDLAPALALNSVPTPAVHADLAVSAELHLWPDQPFLHLFQSCYCFCSRSCSTCSCSWYSSSFTPSCNFAGLDLRFQFLIHKEKIDLSVLCLLYRMNKLPTGCLLLVPYSYALHCMQCSVNHKMHCTLWIVLC